MPLSDSLFETVVKLVQLGGLGVGALIFLFVFILLLQGKPVDPASARLRSRFLTIGTIFAVVALGASLLQLLIVPDPVGAARMTVTFSPSFATENLPAPAMRLIDAGVPRPISEDSPFDIASTATLKISVDELLKSAKSLQQVKATAQTLLESNKALTSALAAPSVAAAAPSATESATVKLIPPEVLFKLNRAQTSIGDSLRSGDYAGAVVASGNYRAAIADTPAVTRRTPS